MVTATAPPETVADLLARLGGIPPERIRMQPPPGLATEADVLAALAAPRKRLCELIDGVLVEKAMGFTEAVLAGAMIDSCFRPKCTGPKSASFSARTSREPLPRGSFGNQ
jgi:hypothetical protein